MQRKLTEFLNQQDYEGLKSNLEIVHPSDLARVLGQMDPDQAREVFVRAPDELQRDVLEAMPATLAAEILEEFDPDVRADLLTRVNPDDAADIFLDFTKEQQEALLPSISDESKRQELIDLISYPPDSAGGIMTTEYVTVNEDATAEQAIEAAREASSQAETIYYVYTTDDSGRLSGVLSMRELLQKDPETPVNDFARRDLFKVRLDDDQEEAASYLERYQLLAVPVVDARDRMRGIVTIDDAMDVMRDEETEDIYKRSGMSSVEALETERSHRVINATVWTNMLVRMPWLIIVGIGGLIAGAVIGAYEATLEEAVTLAFFLPVLMDMGGNVGTQSTTIFVRGMVLGHIDPKTFFKDLIRELLRTGLAFGLIFGGMVFFVAYAMQVWVRGESPERAVLFGVIVGLSMFLIILVASLVGYLVPWLTHLMGWDPAAASNPVVTTIKDITGVLIYFSVATFFLM